MNVEIDAPTIAVAGALLRKTGSNANDARTTAEIACFA
jgi:hypothetical protein